MNENRSQAPKNLRTHRRKKKWTKKRIRRYAKAYFFRILALLIVVVLLLLLKTGIVFAVKAITGGGAKTASVTGTMDSVDPASNSGDKQNSADETGVDETASAESQNSDNAALESTEAETAGEPKEIKTFTLTATGDMTFGRTAKKDYSDSFDEVYDENGADFFFANVRDIFQADDLTLGNLEVSLTESNNKASKKTAVYLKGRPEYVNILSGSSVEMVGLGNNHAGDYGPEGMADTQNALDGVGVKWAVDTTVGYYTTADGIKVGLISKEVIPVTEANTAEMVNGIKEARANGANIVIAAPHWGSEKDYTANDYQVTLAHALIDAGADVVIGNHPHVLQGVELYKGKVIAYSLGNFSFGGNRKPYDWDAIMFQQTFTLYDGVPQTETELDAKVIPIWTTSDKSDNNYQPTVVTDAAAKKILDKVNKFSTELGDLRADENGVLKG